MTGTNSSSSKPNKNNNSSSSNTGAIAGGVVGGVAGVALILGAIWFVFRRRRRSLREGYHQSEHQPIIDAKYAGTPPFHTQPTELDSRQTGAELPAPKERPAEVDASPQRYELEAQKP